VTEITDQIAKTRSRVEESLARSGEGRGPVKIVAVSKRQPAESVIEASAAGLTDFGENYVQEGLDKIVAVGNPGVHWHFIGRIQSNKTRPIAEHFSWVQTLDRERIALRLNEARPDSLEPLNVLIQVNVDREPQKGGVNVDELVPLAERIGGLPRLRLRGVMGMPPAGNGPAQNRASFLAIRGAADSLIGAGFGIDTISMGMSSDYELAIECGSNCVRIGTAIFGERPTE
jgi:pyridoxal phosphate enzyme (YggS family)